MADLKDITARVKALAAQAGFAQVAITSAAPIDAAAFETWVQGDNAGQMDYLIRQGASRYNPAEFLPSAQSVICLASSFRPAPDEPLNPYLPLYVRGRDYHRVLKKRARRFCDIMAEEFEGFHGRISVDAGAIAERSFALRAGMGFRGGQGLLISPKLGICIFLTTIVCNLELQPDAPLDRQCQGCNACRNACPTGAIGDDGLLDARKCLACLLGEPGQTIPSEYFETVNSLYSCDLCLRACPMAAPGSGGEHEFSSSIRPDLLRLKPEDVLAWTLEDWDAATLGSAIRRTKLEQFLIAAILAAGNTGQRQCLPLLKRLQMSHPFLSAVIEFALETLND